MSNIIEILSSDDENTPPARDVQKESFELPDVSNDIICLSDTSFQPSSEPTKNTKNSTMTDFEIVEDKSTPKDDSITPKRRKLTKRPISRNYSSSSDIDSNDDDWLGRITKKIDEKCDETMRAESMRNESIQNESIQNESIQNDKIQFSDDSFEMMKIPYLEKAKKSKNSKNNTSFKILKSPAKKSLMIPDKSFSEDELFENTETANRTESEFELSDLSDSFCMQRIDSTRPDKCGIDLKPVTPDPKKSSIYGNYYAVSPNTAQTYDLQPLTPEAPYSNMSLQDLQAKCDSYGLKRLNKERCIKKLKEIYSYLHRCEDLS